MLLYFWEKLACESIPKPKLQQVGQQLKRLFIGQTCSEQNLNCRTLRNSNMPPLAASEAKSLTVGKRQGHRPAFHQNNPNILAKIQSRFEHVACECLGGKFGSRSAFNQLARAVVGIAPGCGDALGSFRAPAHAAPAEKAAPSGLKVLRISGCGAHVLATGSMISRSRQRAARLNLQHRTSWYRKQKDRKNYSIRLSDQKLFLLQNLDAWIYSEIQWRCLLMEFN